MSGNLHAAVFMKRGRDSGYYVSLTLGGEEVDEAGPFDDELDASEAALRMGDDVRLLEPVPNRMGVNSTGSLNLRRYHA